MHDDQQFGAKPVIEVDGLELSADLLPLIEEVVVDSHLHLPDMFCLRFRDEGKDVLTRAGLRIGTKLTISATAVGDGTQDPLIIGEVTALEAEFDPTGSHTMVRGYDLSHRLCRGRRTRTYRDVTDSELARQLAGDAGLEVGRIEATPVFHEHVSQVNCTDWEFLSARAQEIGYEVAVVLGKLEWRKPQQATEGPGESGIEPTAATQLVLGANLERFRPRITAAEQVTEAVVRGWDPLRKEHVEATVAAATTSADVGQAPDELARTFGETVYVASDLPLSTQAEADAAVASLVEQISGVHAEADAVAHGSPKLRAGSAVSVSLAGSHDGKYTVTAARHVYDEAGYRTHLQISGRAERSLLGLASLGATTGSPSASGPPLYGLVIGVVTDVRDPLDLGRVKVKFPWLADSYESWWARVMHAGAGDQRGAVFLPEVNDEVLVGFEQGDVRRPYVLGGLYNGVDKPRLGPDLVDRSTGAVKRRGVVSKRGHRLVFLDADGKSGVCVLTGDDNLRIALDETATTIKVTSAGKVEISGTSEVTVASSGNVKVEASGSLELKGGAGVTIDGGPQVKVTGGQIQLN